MAPPLAGWGDTQCGRALRARTGVQKSHGRAGAQPSPLRFGGAKIARAGGRAANGRPYGGAKTAWVPLREGGGIGTAVSNRFEYFLAGRLWGVTTEAQSSRDRTGAVMGVNNGVAEDTKKGVLSRGFDSVRIILRPTPLRFGGAPHSLRSEAQSSRDRTGLVRRIPLAGC